jgi:carbamate kinase
LTDVDGVYVGWSTPQQQKLTTVTPDQLRSHTFAAGSMAPKIEAAINFVERGGQMVGIGRLQDVLEILERHAGTIVAV